MDFTLEYLDLALPRVVKKIIKKDHSPISDIFLKPLNTTYMVRICN